MLFVFYSSLLVQAADLQGIHMQADPSKTLIVFDLSGPLKINTFTLLNPPRLVIDIQDTNTLIDFDIYDWWGIIKG